jgi:hypothetical protein
MDGLTKPHLRDLLGINKEYVGYCREERNFAAVLYHLLLDADRLRSFLSLIGRCEVSVDDVHIYFEYAHLRDIWTEVAAQEKDIKAKNERYHTAIASLLRVPANMLPSIDKGDCVEFNAFFTGPRVRAASVKHIQMPSRWSDTQFDRWSEKLGREFAKRACSLKWAFNAKPDLVLHLGGDEAVCIECKLESAAGRYQVESDSNPDGRFRANQLDLQKFILRDLLGYDTDFIMISKKSDWQEGKSGRHWRSYSWQEIYDRLIKDHPPMPGESEFIKEFVER